VQGGVGLDDDVFVGGLLEFVDEHGLAGFQRFGDFRVDAESQVGALVVCGGHLAGFGLNFVAERGAGFDHAGAGAIGAGLAENAFESLLGAFAGDANETELVERERFRRGFILLQGLLQRAENFFAVAALFHVDEIDDDDAAQIAQADLADDFLHRFDVGLDDGVFEASRAFADELAGVDVDGDERFGVVDDDVAAGLQIGVSLV
jgi:hypothetical protein